MTDRLAGLLAAVCERPFDNLPRRVYADELEGTGDPENVARAEFIRAQLDLDELCPRPEECQFIHGHHFGFDPNDRDGGYCCCRCAWDYDAAPFHARAAELRRKYGGVWDSAVVGSGVMSFKVRRGFVESMKTTLREWVGRVPCDLCPRMSGRIWAESATPGGRVGGMRTCPRCYGAGRLGAVGPLRVRRLPLVEVKLWNPATDPDLSPRPSLAEHVLVDLRDRPEEDFETALSRTLVDWARRAAGMTPLYPPPRSD